LLAAGRTHDRHVEEVIPVSRSALHNLAHPMLALAGLSTIVSAVLGSPGDWSSEPHSRLATSSTNIVSNVVSAVAFLLLAVGIAALADHRGPEGRGFGPWPMALGITAVVVSFFTAAARAFVQPALATAAPSLLDSPPSGLLAVGVFGALLISIVGLVTFGVAAYRNRTFPRTAAVLVVVGVVAFPLQSVASLLFGAGLLWAAVIGLRARPVLSELVG
jgi:hypothetical protein